LGSAPTFSITETVHTTSESPRSCEGMEADYKFNWATRQYKKNKNGDAANFLGFGANLFNHGDRPHYLRVATVPNRDGGGQRM